MHVHLLFHTHTPLFEICALVFKVDFEVKLVFKNKHMYRSFDWVAIARRSKKQHRCRGCAKKSFAEFERWQRRAVSNIDSLKLFATLKEAYPLICMIQKCLLACPPSQSDCEELFSLLGLY